MREVQLQPVHASNNNSQQRSLTTVAALALELLQMDICFDYSPASIGKECGRVQQQLT
jgi:hypothetical protein